jgi:hypothetical protein
MAATREPRQREHATGANRWQGMTPPAGHEHTISIAPLAAKRDAVELRRRPGCCPRCAAPLVGTPLERQLGSGEHIGGTGDSRTYRCPSGATLRELHAEWMRRRRWRAA